MIQPKLVLESYSPQLVEKFVKALVMAVSIFAHKKLLACSRG